MLWYKAWLETRTRFVISLLGLVALPCYLVFEENRDGNANTRIDWYYHALHNGHILMALMWGAAVMLLMMGGLLREKASGTSAFTLALPVSRTRLMLVRVFTGFLQAMALVAIPWGAMFLVAITTGRASSVPQALFHVVSLGTGGLVFFSMAVFISSVVEGEYTAPVVSFGILFADFVGLGPSKYHAYSTWNFMAGSEYFDRSTQMVTGVSWAHVIVNLVVAAVLTVASIKAIQKREF